jgi:YbbR domain-containing protein
MPETVLVLVDRFVTHRVPVRLDVAYSFRDGYGQVGSVRVHPDSVDIGGAEAVVSRLDSWPTERVLFEDLRAPFDTHIPLASSGTYQLTFSTQSVRVALNVQPFAEKILSGLPVEVRSVPRSQEVILIPPRIELVVRGGIRQLSTLSPSDVDVTIDYASIIADSTGIIETHVNAPEGIQVVQKRPERLQYIVRKSL